MRRVYKHSSVMKSRVWTRINNQKKNLNKIFGNVYMFPNFLLYSPYGYFV